VRLLTECIPFEGFKARVEHVTGISSLVIDLPDCSGLIVYKYQVEMAANNPGQFLLPFEIRRKDESSGIYYNIAANVCLADYLKQKEITKKEFIGMLKELTLNLLESRGFLLYERNFLMKEDFIYVDPATGRLRMVYLPVNAGIDSSRDFKNLIMGLVSKTVSLKLNEGDRYLKKIVDYSSSPDFNTNGLLKLLNEIGNISKLNGSASKDTFGGNKDPIPDNIPKTERFQQQSKDGNVVNTLFERVSGFFRKKADKPDGPDILPINAVTDTFIKKTGFHNYAGMLKSKSFGKLVISQTVVIPSALAVEWIMKKCGAQADTRYISISILVLSVDLLVYKYFIDPNRRNNGNPEPVKTKKSVKRLQCHSKVNREMLEDGLYEQLASRDEELRAGNRNKDGMKHFAEETARLDGEKPSGAFLHREIDGRMDGYKVSKNGFIIGRSPEVSDMVIDEKSIGRVQAEIIFRNGDYYAVDKNSVNGTHLNGKKLEGGVEYHLRDGDLIMFANLEYRFTIGGNAG